MANKRIRPLPTKKERVGVYVVVALLFVEYFLCIAILSGDLDTQFIYSLDLTGQWAIAGERWANASTPYRDLMIPVYITANIFLYAVILVIFMTRDWQSIAGWEKNIGYGWVFISWGMVWFLYWFATSLIGSGEVIYDPNELHRIVERPAFGNKYFFILILFFFAICGYQFSDTLVITTLKVKKSISNQLKGE